MASYKWESLKLKACQMISAGCSLYHLGIHGECLMVEQMRTGQPVKSWRENGEAMRLKAWEICERWDIRCARKLFECFPSIIPKKYQGQNCIADYDDKGDWVIIF